MRAPQALAVALAGAAAALAMPPSAAIADTPDTSWYQPSATVSACFDNAVNQWGPYFQSNDCYDPSFTNHDYCGYQYQTGVSADSSTRTTRYEIGACPTSPNQTDPSNQCLDLIDWPAPEGWTLVGPKDCPAGTRSNPYPEQTTPVPTPPPPPRSPAPVLPPLPPAPATTPPPTLPAPAKVKLSATAKGSRVTARVQRGPEVKLVLQRYKTGWRKAAKVVATRELRATFRRLAPGRYRVITKATTTHTAGRSSAVVVRPKR